MDPRIRGVFAATMTLLFHYSLCRLPRTASRLVAAPKPYLGQIYGWAIFVNFTQCQPTHAPLRVRIGYRSRDSGSGRDSTRIGGINAIKDPIDQPCPDTGCYSGKRPIKPWRSQGRWLPGQARW